MYAVYCIQCRFYGVYYGMKPNYGIIQPGYIACYTVLGEALAFIRYIWEHTVYTIQRYMLYNTRLAHQKHRK